MITYSIFTPEMLSVVATNYGTTTALAVADKVLSASTPITIGGVDIGDIVLCSTNKGTNFYVAMENYEQADFCAWLETYLDSEFGFEGKYLTPEQAKSLLLGLQNIINKFSLSAVNNWEITPYNPVDCEPLCFPMANAIVKG